MSRPDSPPVLALVRDLMFAGRITATARAAGANVKMIRDPAALMNESAARLIVDLNQDGALDAAAAWKERAGGAAEVIGFVAHTDAAIIARARELGIDRVMPRGQFVQVLPELLSATTQA